MVLLITTIEWSISWLTNPLATCINFHKVLLHRSAGTEAAYLPVIVTSFNQDLFLLCWSQTVAALSYVFENTEEKAIVQKTINGFRCAVFCYEMFLMCVV